jgi:hypothetical protein
MRKTTKFGLVILGGGFAVLSLLGAPTALWAQGCALCYQSAAASGPRAIEALKSGILILVFPPTFICIAIGYLAYCRRDLHNHDS